MLTVDLSWRCLADVCRVSLETKKAGRAVLSASRGQSPGPRLTLFFWIQYNGAPWVPGFGEASEKTKRVYDSESDFLDQHKAFVMKHGGIASDLQYESVKRETIAAFSNYTALYAKQRMKKGESPIEGDFLAERETLSDAVASVSKTNPLFAFAKNAVDSLDGNAGWSYGRKLAALSFLANKAERYEGGEGAEAEAKE